jgi:ribosomal protein S7
MKKNNTLNFFILLLNNLLKRGEKTKILNCLIEIFRSLSFKFQQSPFLIVSSLRKRLTVNVDTRSIRTRKKSHIAPFYLKDRRRMFVLARWIKHALLENKSPLCFSDKLTLEFTDVLKNNKNSKILNQRKISHDLIVNNFANKHFRWAK